MTVLTIAACACGSSPRGSEPSVLAVGTDPIALYVVNDGKVEEQRSGIAPAWSPDGRQLAYGGDYDGSVWVDDRSYPVGDIATGGPEWTPDGRFLLYERGGIRLLDTATGTEELVAPGTWPALSPDGHTVAYLRYKRKKGTTDPIASTLQVVELAGGEARVLARTTGPPFGPHFESRPQWFADGSAVAVARRITQEGTWAVERVGLDGTREDIVPEIGEEFALSPDGRLIAYQLTEYRIALGVAEVGTSGNVYQLGKLVPKASLGLRNFGGLTWSPDGQEIAFYLSSGSGEIMRVYALEATTGETRRLAEIEQAAYAELAWKPDP
jgi:Tol biopolymer transport system component